MTGGDEEAARQITNGFAPLHEMPGGVMKAGPRSIAAWAIERGEQYRHEHFPDIDLIDFKAGEKSNG